jgi:hypothetical protein
MLLHTDMERYLHSTVNSFIFLELFVQQFGFKVNPMSILVFH